MSDFVAWASSVKTLKKLPYRVLGDRVGVSATHIHDMLKGKASISFEMAVRIIVALEESPWLIFNHPEYLPHHLRSSDYLSVINLFSSLPQSKRPQVVDYIRFIAQ